jgi:hypothetical protein
MMNLSPEEILRSKEASSGFVYDEPKIEPAQTDAKEEMKAQQQPLENSFAVNENNLAQQNVFTEERPKPEQPLSLGRVERKPYIPEERPAPKNSADPGEVGWKNLPMGILPSKGMFYPDGTRIAIRSAEVKEIRHFSTIDEDDRLDIEEKLGYILDKCMRIDFPGLGLVSYQDLKSEDRFFVIMAIRDLTFTKGENSVILIPDVNCDTNECPLANGFELRTGVLSVYEIDPDVMKFYDPAGRCFSFDVQKLNKSIKMYVPSIGVSRKISEFVISLAKKGFIVDEAFIKISPFVFENWRSLTEGSFQAKLSESDTWSKEEFSLLFELSERIKIGTKSKALVQCPKCGGREVTADITFPEGLKSIFVISNILRELL